MKIKRWVVLMIVISKSAAVLGRSRFKQFIQIAPQIVISDLGNCLPEGRLSQKPFLPGNLLQAGDPLLLPLLDETYKNCSVEQRIVGSGVEPGYAPPQPLHESVPSGDVLPYQIGNFVFSARGFFQARRTIANLLVEKIEAGDRPLGTRMKRLLFNQIGRAHV